MAAEHICRYNQTGYCKFKNLCRYRHIDEVCDVTDCENHECLKRHPRVCRYFQFRGYCKFSDHCAYAHQERKEVKEIEILKRRLDDALRCIEVLEKNTRMFESVEAENLSSLEAFDNSASVAESSRKDGDRSLGFSIMEENDATIGMENSCYTEKIGLQHSSFVTPDRSSNGKNYDCMKIGSTELGSVRNEAVSLFDPFPPWSYKTP